MIVNLKSQERFAGLKLIMRWIRLAIGQTVLRREKKIIFRDSFQLKSHFMTYYPKLKKDSVDNSLCISCHLCSDICPTQAIEVVKPNFVNFPKSLKTGESPKNFFLDVSSCTRCNQCAIVCPVGAIELSGNYHGAKRLDLVSKGHN